MAIRIEAFGDSVCRYGESLCGDRVEIVRNGAGVTVMLADGMGGGIKANMLSCFAVKMMSTLLGRGAPVEEIAGMIAESQPAGSEDGASHSAFTLIQAAPDGAVSIAQMETPDVLLFRRGKPVSARTGRTVRQGRLIRLAAVGCGEADAVVAVSGGVLRAGKSRGLEKSWQMQNISKFLSQAYRPGIPPEKLVRLLLNAGSSLSGQKPKDDLTAVAVRMEKDGMKFSDDL